MLGQFLQFATSMAGAALSDGPEMKAYMENQEELRQSAYAENLNAVDALLRGAVAAGRMRSRSSQLVAKQRLAYVSSGVDASVGTPLEVASSTALMTELDVQSAMNDAVREAWGHKRAVNSLNRQRRIGAANYNAQQANKFMNLAGQGLSLIGGAAGGG